MDVYKIKNKEPKLDHCGPPEDGKKLVYPGLDRYIGKSL